MILKFKIKHTVKKELRSSSLRTPQAKRNLHWKYRRYLQISAKRAKQGNPPHLTDASNFVMSSWEIKHGFRGDPKQRYIGDISGTKSKNKHVFRVSLNGPQKIADIR